VYVWDCVCVCVCVCVCAVLLFVVYLMTVSISGYCVSMGNLVINE
jgi:hypothetical protein